MCCVILEQEAVHHNPQAIVGVTGQTPNIGVRFEAYDEEWELQLTHRRSLRPNRQLRDVDILNENRRRLRVYLPGEGIILNIGEGCILVTLMLTSAQSLDYYKDPDQTKAMGEKLKQLLKTLRQENNLDFSDVDGIKISISEKDIQSAEKFFNIGKYHICVKTLFANYGYL